MERRGGRLKDDDVCAFGGRAQPQRQRLVGRDERIGKKNGAGVDRLPDFLKQVVILAYYQSLKYKDIAEIMGIPVGTVKSRLHSALMRLQEAWSEMPAVRE